VSRNLWHSCGTYTLKDLFAKSAPAALQVATAYVDVLRSLGDVQVIPQRSRLVCVARVRFAGLYPRKNGFLAGFALHRWLRWRGHFVLVTSGADVDDELRAWLQESHDTVGLQSDVAPPSR
jgi:hypothetical protein